MKTMRKLFALAMAMMMVFALAANASATTVTIENVQAGTKYDAYQLLEIASQSGDSIVYKSTAAWKDFWKATVGTVNMTDYFTVQDDDVIVAKTEYDETAAKAVAQAAKQYAEDKGITGYTVTATNPAANPTTISVGENGYYLMTSSLGNLCTLATINGTDLTLREKNKDLPTVTKTIVGDATTYNVGDTINFKVEIECEEGKDSYTLHDQMTGIDLNASSIQVKVEGAVIGTNSAAGTYYTVVNPAGDCTFEIVIHFDPVTEAYQKVEVTYSAIVNEGAVDGLTNKAWVDDHKDPEGGDVEVTYNSFEVTKTDSATNTQIDGAKFELYYADGEDKVKVPVVQVTVDGETYYRPAKDGETPVEIEAGKAAIKGLDKTKTYYLKETEAPAGYVPIDDYKVVDGTAVTVPNTKGSELPETGGMGTTLFYVFGGLMVAAAVVLLVTKKRMTAE